MLHPPPNLIERQLSLVDLANKPPTLGKASMMGFFKTLEISVEFSEAVTASTL